jgi:ABC-type polysaccharide/polyol phosphate transport system ATPase subunit
MDEWLLAGDAHFLTKAKRRLLSFIDRSSILVLASHSNALLTEWCTKGLYLERGEVKAFGPIEDVLAQYAGSVASE